MGIVAFKAPVCIHTMRLETISLKIVIKELGLGGFGRFVWSKINV